MLRSVVVASVLAALLTACGGGDAEGQPTPDPAPATAEVPDGVTPTDPGTALGYGDSATLVWQPTTDLTGVLDLTVQGVQERRASVFDGWLADDTMQEARPYFVSVTLTNVGDRDLAGQAVPLYLRDDRDRLGAPWTLGGDFAPCQSGPCRRPSWPGRAPRCAWSTSRPTVLASRTWSSSPPRATTPSPGPATSVGRRRSARAPGADLGRPSRRLDNGAVTALPTSLTLGPLRVDTPVVLAPMAGITNAAYRRLCAEQGAGLYVCEMITSRGLVEGDETTLKMLVFDELETVRSVQLYGTDPVYVGKAVEILCADYGVAHVDLNFGCPVPKVTRKGGGGALPWKRGLLGEILTAAVAAAAPYDVPVTMKTRKGLDDDHLTYLDAGRIAQETGVVGHRAARSHRAAGLLRRGRLGRHRAAGRARRHPGPRQRRHLGGVRRAADGRADRRRRRGRRPRLPGPAVALPRPGRRLPRRRPSPPCRPSARSAR